MTCSICCSVRWPERTNQSRTRNELIEMLQPGDVLVIDALGREDGGHIGDVIATRVQSRPPSAVVRI